MDTKQENIQYITKLVRKDPLGKWWYTLRWVKYLKDNKGGMLTQDNYYDSHSYTSYKEFNQAAAKYKAWIRDSDRH